MADNTEAEKKDGGSLEGSLATLGQRIQQAKATRPGSIVFHAAGAGSGTYRLHTGQGQTRMVPFGEAADDKQPLIEVIGDAATLRAILEGKKDAVKTFIGGGLRVRGDLGYLSELALELGFIDKPL
jgi:hypothetical protein